MGVFDFLNADTGSAPANSPGLFGGGMPLSHTQKVQLLLSGLQDSLSSLDPALRGGHLDATNNMIMQANRQGAYNNALGTMFAAPQPNEVSVTPRIQLDPNGKPIPNDPSAYQQPAMTPGGSLSAYAPMLPILKGLPAEQGMGALAGMAQTALGPHGFDVVQAQDGPHKVDKLTGQDLGLIGSPKPMTFDPTKVNLIPNSLMPQGQDGGAQAAQPAPMNAGQRNLANNNPGNLRVPGKQAFQTFPTMEAGIGAVTNQLGLYGKRGLNTVASIISTYAPPSDGNDTAAYTKGVASDLGVDPNTPLNMKDPHILAAMTQSILKHEQGGTPIQGQDQQQQAAQTSGLPNIPGYTTLAPRQQWRTITDPAEAKRLNINVGSQINSVTGEEKPLSTYSMPSVLSGNDLDSNAMRYNLTGQMPSGLGRGSNEAKQILKRAGELAPPEIQSQGPGAIAQWQVSNAQNYKSGQSSLTNFDQGKLGNQVRSFSVGLSHLDTLQQLANALGNGNTQAINSLQNTFKTQFGKNAPTNFNAARDIVADEIVKAIVGSGGGVGDREKAAASVNAAQSPQQLLGVINTYKTLMAGQLHGLAQQYKVSTGRNDFATRLSPEAQRLMAPPPSPGNLPGQNKPKVVHWNDLP